MRPLETRKAVKAIRRLCSDSGIVFAHDLGRGRGSHGSLIFQHGDESIRIVIVNDMLSPGVQRGAIRYVESLIGKKRHAEAVARLLRAIFPD